MPQDVFGIVGTEIGEAYRVERVVAVGGSVVVYQALRSAFRDPVALKCLKMPQGFSAVEKSEFLERLRSEAELLSHLSASSPSLARPLHVDALVTEAAEFVPFMVLEWLEGETLDVFAARRRAQGSPLTLKQLMRLLNPVALVLDQAHDFPGPNGRVCVVHCDLKPANLLVTEVEDEEVVRILDFGVGKARSVAEQVVGPASARDSGWTSFSPAHGAPEQWAPRRFGQTGAWTDVWGLALTIVETLAGHPVIDGDEAEMMGTVLDPEQRPTPRREGAAVSDDVEAVFTTALAVDPRNRYQLVKHFWGDLSQAVGEGESSVPPATPSEAAPTPARPDASANSLLDVPRIPIPRVPDLGTPVRSQPGLQVKRRVPRGAIRSGAIGHAPDPLSAVPSEQRPTTKLEVDQVRDDSADQAERVELAPVSTRPIQVVASPPVPVRPESPIRDASLSTVLSRLLPGLALVVLAVGVSIGGQAYAARTGTTMPMGWLAGPLLLVGIGVAVYRFLSAGSD